MSRLLLSLLPVMSLALPSLSLAVGPYTYHVIACSDQASTTDRSQVLKFSGTSLTLRPRSSDFPSSGANAIRRSELNAAIAEWNEAPQNFRFSTSDGTTGSTTNNTSEVFVQGGICDGTLCALLRGSCSAGTTAADVVISPDVAVTASQTRADLTAYGGPARQLRSSLMHELGHVLGMAHNTTSLSLMGVSQTHLLAQGTGALGYVGGYEARLGGLIYGYRSGAGEEVTVSHWRRNGSSGGASQHTGTRLLDGSGLSITPSVGACGVSAFNVRRGTVVQPGFSFENGGANPLSGVLVTFFLSSDMSIGPPDRQIGETRIDISRGPADDRLGGTNTATGETFIPVTIPSTSAGLFFLGVNIDRDNTVNEVDEDPFFNTVPPLFTGNATYMQTRICVTN